MPLDQAPELDAAGNRLGTPRDEDGSCCAKPSQKLTAAVVG